MKFNIALACSVLTVSALTSAVFAAEVVRTTPVEVRNPLQIDKELNFVRSMQEGNWIFGIDPSTNTVKAGQSGPWNVGISGTANVSVTNTPSVSISGTPNVSITNIPIVSVGNTPSVNISGTPNVKSQISSTTIRPWTSFTSIADKGTLTVGPYTATGYKEMRVVLTADIPGTAPQTSLKAVVYWHIGAGLIPLGQCDFGQDTDTPLVKGGNFKSNGMMCVFTMPVMGDSFSLYIVNDTGATVTIKSYSWVYLVS